MKTRTVLALTGVLLATSFACAQVPTNSVRIEGPITAIDPVLLQLVVTDVTVQVTDTTIIKERGRTIGFDQLALGATVAACGLIEDDVLVANRVTVRPCVPVVPVTTVSTLQTAVATGTTRIEGVITAIDADLLQLLVADTLVQVTDTTLIRERGQIIGFDQLEVGITVAACGTLTDDVLVAQHVTVRPGATVAMVVGNDPGKATARGAGTGAGVGSLRIEAPITAIDADLLQLVVDGTTVQVTENTLIRMQGRAITFGNLELGMTVAVCGIPDGDILVANRVTVRLSVAY